MKTMIVVFAFFALFSMGYSAEYAPDSSRLPPDGNWSNAGVSGGIPTTRTQCGETVAAGTSASTVQNLLNACGNNTYLLLGPGTFNWSTTIIIPERKTLRGSGSSGANQTTIVNNGAVFYIGSSDSNYPYLDSIYGTGARVLLSSGYTKGSDTIITAATPSIFSVGDLVIITQLEGDNSDGYTISTSGQGQRLESPNRAPGQITKIANINSNTITLADKLNYTYRSGYDPQMVRVAPSGVDASHYLSGIEDLQISRPNPTYSNTIGFWRADQCWVKNVVITINCSQQGCGSIYLGLSYRCQIQQCYLHHSCTYASGGNGYLLTLSAYSTKNLITNNAFCFANEGLFLKMTNSNVISYNYLDSSWVNEGGTLQMADYGTHGEWPYMDLFEGNFSTKSEIGGVWGGASRLFFFRNYHDARHQWGCVVGGDPNPTAHNTQDRAGFQSQSATAYATYIGNVAGIYGDSPNLSYKSGSQDSVFFYRSGTGTQDYATAFHGYTHNLTTGTTTWDEITEGSTIKNSYYLSSKPSFFGSIAWPPIGPDIVGYTIETPAKIFFDTGSWPDEAPTPTLTIPGGFTISGGKVE